MCLIYFAVLSTAGFTEKLAAKRIGSGLLSLDFGVFFFKSFGLISGGLFVDFMGDDLILSSRLDCASAFWNDKTVHLNIFRMKKNEKKY